MRSIGVGARWKWRAACFALALLSGPRIACPLSLAILGPLKLANGQEADIARKRLPRQASSSGTGFLLGVVRNEIGLGLGEAVVQLRNNSTGQSFEVRTSGEGIFRFLNLTPGNYTLTASREGFQAAERSGVKIVPGEVTSLELSLSGGTIQPGGTRELPRPGLPRELPTSPPAALPPYPTAPQTPASPATGEQRPLEPLPPEDSVFTPTPDRWKYDWPTYRRYDQNGEDLYTVNHWYDPFHRNKFKGDSPIFGNRTFLNITGTSDTFLDGRRLPTPSNVGSERPGSREFFGRFGQFFTSENLSLSLDLFHGDTSFRPVDWRIRITPAANFNFLHAQERGIVNADVRMGTDRFDAHLGLQEAFIEVKFRDLSPRYDFVSARVGIQNFNSDFRGFIFNDQEPGVRILGNLRSNLYQYNLAYFHMLEKDTNSGLNTLTNRHQQVYIANLYRQDFLKKGYTVQVSFHFNQDDRNLRFDSNNFLVRPAPIGIVAPHNVRAYYAGMTGTGHLGRINITHAFYQAFGHDDLNLIAGKRVNIDAQMVALELSVDRDWYRVKGSFFWASGSSNPRSGVARGFDTIFDNPNFAGGFFSFWNREGIRLTGTGVSLENSDSLVPNLRTSKLEGQANFVNPGLFLYNGGVDFDVTPKIRSFVNVNLLRFHHTAPLELLLFQKPIHAGLGADSSVGVNYRPPLSDNIILTGGVSVFVPWQGFKDIYSGKTLFSVFGNIRLKF